MSNHDMVLNNNPGLTFRTDLNSALMALATNNSGTTEPPTKYAGQIWLDLSITNGSLRLRNNANSSWIPLQFYDVPTVSTGTGAGTVLTTGNSIYSGSDANNSSFPVGTILMVKGTVTQARNASLAVKLSATAGQYDLVGATAVSGVWRQRGQFGAASDWTYLAQRVS